MTGTGGAAPGADDVAAARARADVLFDELTVRLLTEDAVSPGILRLRADLAVAEAEARLVDRALFQLDELVADAERALDPEDRLLGALRAEAAAWFDVWGLTEKAAELRARP